jgi:hypothetical protein
MTATHVDRAAWYVGFCVKRGIAGKPAASEQELDWLMRLYQNSPRMSGQFGLRSRAGVRELGRGGGKQEPDASKSSFNTEEP